MPALAIGDIKVDPTVQIRRSNHEATIQRYQESFENLPPIVVFETAEGLLLADGFHRVAAAERLGRRDIEAEVRPGTREDALEFAVIANTKNAQPLLPEERDNGIRRLKQLHPKWSSHQIANAMSVGETTVRDLFQIDKVKRETFLSGARVRPPSNSHYRAIAHAPEQQRQPLVEAMQKREWSSDATALAVQNLKDDRIPEERKQAILKGKADPVRITPEGEFAVPIEIVNRQIKETASNDAVLAMEKALEALARLRLFRPEVIVSTIGRPRLERLVGEIPGYIQFMEDVLEAARKYASRMELVK